MIVAGSAAGLRCIRSWRALCLASAATSATLSAFAEEAPREPVPASADTSRAPIPASEAAARSGWLIGGYAASFVPVGAWADHPYAGRTIGSVTYDEGLDQFGPGFGIGFEIGWKARRRIQLTLGLEVTTLGTGEWEDEAARHGSDVSAHAAQISALMLLSIELFATRTLRTELRLGLGIMSARGGETVHDLSVSYGYDFLGTSFASRAGVGGGLRISKAVDLMLLVDFQGAIPGTSYPNHSAPYLGFVGCLGPRFWFGPKEGG